MSSPAFMGSLFLTALIALVTPRQQRSQAAETAADAMASRSFASVAAAMQGEITAYLRVNDAGNANWPNDGAIPVIAYGWGGDRPLPARLRADSLNPIFARPLKSPTLNFQIRDDIFSPLLERLAGQNERIAMMSFVVNRWRGGPITFNLYDVQIISMRNVGQVFDETPVTQEVVLAFSRIEQAVD